MQADRNLMIGPGETDEAKLYFFNIHGNRITHVRLYLRDVPEGWNVRIEPEAGVKQFKVSGLTVNSTENLYVEPSTSVSDLPENIPEGVEYIKMEGVDGYIPAKVARIIISVPEDEEAGKTEKIGVEAIANWFGQKGMVTFSQSRTFEYFVTTISKEYSEEIVETAEEKNISENIEFLKFQQTYLVIGLLILIILIQLILYIRKR